MRHSRRAFTIVELFFVLLGLAGAVLLPALRSGRSSAIQTTCMVNLRDIAMSTMTYATDNQDALPAFSWSPEALRDGRAGRDGQARQAQSDIDAAAMQARDIIARRAREPGIDAPARWFPHLTWSHLVLADYMAARIPERTTACPADAVRSAWVKGEAPADIPPPPHTAWKVSSSYQLVPAAYTPDRFGDDGGYLRQGEGQGVVQYAPGDRGRYRFKPRRIGEVRFPGAKVLWMEDVAWHTPAGSVYYSDPSAKANLLFADAHVEARLSADANPGGHVRADGTTEPATVTYEPRPYLREPPWRAGAGEATQVARYRWTAGGLTGADFGQQKAPPAE